MSEFFRRIGRELGVEPGNHPTSTDRSAVKSGIATWKERFKKRNGTVPTTYEIADAGVLFWRKRGGRL